MFANDSKQQNPRNEWMLDNITSKTKSLAQGTTTYLRFKDPKALTIENTPRSIRKPSNTILLTHINHNQMYLRRMSNIHSYLGIPNIYNFGHLKIIVIHLPKTNNPKYYLYRTLNITYIEFEGGYLRWAWTYSEQKLQGWAWWGQCFGLLSIFYNSHEIYSSLLSLA